MNDKKAVRMYQLGEKYLPKNIAERFFQNPCYVQEEYYKLIKPKKNYTNYNKRLQEKSAYTEYRKTYQQKFGIVNKNKDDKN